MTAGPIPEAAPQDRPREPLFDDLLRLLGRLNYTWTNTESLLIHLIAGLAGTTKETAVVIYLTLNTTRARADLVERLAKTGEHARDERERVLAVTGRLLKLAGLRNRYNHCIFAFDPQSGSHRTILMRISDRKDEIRMGKSETIDADALHEIEAAIDDLAALNRAIWALVLDRGYPA